MSLERNRVKAQIRLAVPEDAAPIASVLHEAFKEYRSCYTPAGFAATTPPSEEILNRLKEGPLWVAVYDDAVVGTISAVAKDKDLYIRGMGIVPGARGQRIGECLLQHVERFAEERGFQRLFLSTTPFLHPAICLYEKFGFRRTSEGPHHLFGTPLFTMEKTGGVFETAAPITESEVESVNSIGSEGGC
ncbi:MAG TPA: GNAT family N-acetyltransferase [Pyrinomonadaceae bacterium]|nr:GNAT family N-acetyltransferase [Pyrinomonadaceae bacterium]